MIFDNILIIQECGNNIQIDIINIAILKMGLDIHTETTEAYTFVMALTDQLLSINVCLILKKYQVVFHNQDLPTNVSAFFPDCLVLFNFLKEKSHYDIDLQTHELIVKLEIDFGTRIQTKKIYVSLKECRVNQSHSEKNDRQLSQKINKIVEDKNKQNQDMLRTKFVNNCRLIKEISENLDRVLQNIPKYKNKQQASTKKMSRNQPAQDPNLKLEFPENYLLKTDKQIPLGIDKLDSEGNGRIRLEYENGDIYEGDIQNFQFHGYGRYNHANGERYIGEYQNGLREGRGEYYFVDGHVYKGQFKENEIDGMGTYFYPDGDKFEGSFRNQLKNGRGVYYFRYGGRFEGIFRDDQENGKGVLFYTDGTSDIELWKNGVLYESG